MSDHTKCCVDCKATRTPLWRTGPAGPRSLCNACGIRYRKRKASSRSNTRTTPKINDVTQLQHLFSTDKDHHHHHQSSCSYSSTSYSGSTGSSTTTTSAAVVVDDNNTNTTTSVGNQEEFNTKVVPFVGFKKKGSGFDLNNQNINRHSSDDDEEFRRRKRREWRSRRRKMGEVEEAAVLLMSLSYGAPHICLKF